MGALALRLEVRSDNAAAIALYERLGFRQFGRYEDYYADGATGVALRKSRSAARPPRRREETDEKYCAAARRACCIGHQSGHIVPLELDSRV